MLDLDTELERLCIRIKETQVSAMEYGLKLDKVIVSNKVFSIMVKDYGQRFHADVDIEHLRNNGFTLMGLKGEVRDYDFNGNPINDYIPVYTK